jgi:hypothetical protein
VDAKVDEKVIEPNEAANQILTPLINLSLPKQEENAGTDKDGSVNIDTSLLEVASIMDYLAQCDLSQAGSGHNISNDLCYGRGYLMKMLGNCVAHFWQEAEGSTKATEQLNQTLESNRQKQAKLLELNGLYKTLTDFPNTGEKSALAQLKQNIQACEDTLGLSEAG